MSSAQSFVTRLRYAARALVSPASTDRLNARLEALKINQGVILATLNQGKTSTSLQDFEFQVFSQWGEDGIIQHLLDVVEIKNKTFIEFGVEDFTESNCRFLMMKNNWKGFVIDGSRENIARLRQAPYFWKYHLVAVDAFITRENVAALLARSGFDQDLGILSIDIDGNDYYVLEALAHLRPRILICEYNALFGASRKISIVYDPGFRRQQFHYSNLCYGASLSAMTYLANLRGYTLVGTNSIGTNAFFVRNDLLTEKLERLVPEQAYFPSNIRESRDAQGRQTCLTGDERLDQIRGLPVFNVETGQAEIL